MKFVLIFFGLLTLFFYQLQALDTKTKIANYEPNVLVVKFKPQYKNLVEHHTTTGFGLFDLDNIMANIGVIKIESHFHPNPKKYKAGLPDISLIYRITYTKNRDPYSIAENLMRYKYLEYAEPMFIDELQSVPNDLKYSLSSYLTSLQASSAWDLYKGENDTIGVVIGHIDTGVKWSHPDLIDNIWNNIGEDADHDGKTVYYNGTAWVWDPGDVNGIDDDENGYIDDFIGWDFEKNSAHEQRNDPLDSSGHGTNTAGIANAKTNNTIGVASIPWNVKLMPISCSSGSSIVNGYRGIVYAAENGADIINCSWGSKYSWSQANEEAIAYAYGLGSVICAAAGNNNNREPVYPAAYPRVVSVSSVTDTGLRIPGYCFGSFVDVVSPTQNMWTTNMYDTLSVVLGATSYASPVGSGLSALIKAKHHNWTNAQVINQLIASTTNIDALNPGYANKLGDGKLNAYQALNQVNPLVDQELRLILFDVLPPSDANANSAIEKGETFSLNLKIRNYTHGVSSDNVTYTLSTTDTTITILNNTAMGSVIADGYSTLSNAFSCRVSDTATTHYATFTLNMAADLPVAIDSVQSFSLLINAGGVFVWEGKAGAGYSGRRIRDTLTNQGYSVCYGTTFPLSLHGFSAVFMSFGMVSSSGFNATRFDKLSMYQAVKNYLDEGGRLYMEGNDAIGWDLSTYLPDVGEGLSAAEVLFPMLGIATYEDGSTNGINGLTGQTLSYTNGLSFTSTTQTKLETIDKFTPTATGAIAFIESGYGNVAIQNYGNKGQKSLIFSYCLAELVDRTSPSTRDSLLMRIMRDFLIPDNTMLSKPDLHIERFGDSIKLSWNAISNAVSYRIESSANPLGGFTALQTITGTQWTTSQTYQQKYYRVIARTDGL